MNCKFNQDEIFQFLDTDTNTEKIKQCHSQFINSTYDLLHNNNYKTKISDNCPLLNPYQMHNLNKLTNSDLDDAFKVKDSVYTNDATVKPINSSCHNDIKLLYKH
jgi:hypothetical protein